MSRRPISLLAVAALTWSVVCATVWAQSSASATRLLLNNGDYRVAQWTTAEGLP
jgi:hypothetical protein